ncbi:MAG: adenosylcobinamide-GDP ribazoletransferase [Clostridium sp.]|nr:adenosylcobinamide-GDP ribazoletransferase [Lachnoclostridium sp.]MCM1254090.1 adenosylcobinamide-GDP ribazoletransferase [Clostridium sp.]
MVKHGFDKANSKYYILCFYPVFGVVIGAVMYAFNALCLHFGFGQACFALIGVFVPVLLSGARPLEEFITTADMLITAAYHGKKKAEPAEDAPPGAYGVIAGAAYCMLYAGSLAVIWKDRQLVLLGMGYMISRTLYSMAYVWFGEAETEKKLTASLSAMQRRTLRLILGVILALCFGTCIAVSPIMGMLEALICMWIWTYHYYLSRRLSGGVTKKLSGYFLTLCELAVVLFVGMFGRVLL